MAGSPVTGPCLLCPDPFHPGAQGIVIPRGYVHLECYHRDGRTPGEIGAAYRCCDSRLFVESLDGGVFQRKASVPRGQLWLLEEADGKKKLYRFSQRHGQDPPVVLLQVLEEEIPHIDVTRGVRADGENLSPRVEVPHDAFYAG